MRMFAHKPKSPRLTMSVVPAVLDRGSWRTRSVTCSEWPKISSPALSVSGSGEEDSNPKEPRWKRQVLLCGDRKSSEVWLCNPHRKSSKDM